MNDIILLYVITRSSKSFTHYSVYTFKYTEFWLGLKLYTYVVYAIYVNGHK